MADSEARGAASAAAPQLSQQQQDVLTELQKILLTLKQINESLGQTIQLTGDGGSATERRLRKSAAAAVEAGREAFESLAEEDDEEEDGGRERAASGGGEYP